MDDEGGDWFADAGGEAPSQPQKEVKEAAIAETVEVNEAPAEEPSKEVEADEFFDPDKVLLFKHWIRPKFLQYSYLYNYRHNYYDDVIDYLDKRQKGLSRDVPRAQTWPERVLRSHRKNREDYFKKVAEDTRLISSTQLSGSFFHYHTKQYVNRRFSLLY